MGPISTICIVGRPISSDRVGHARLGHVNLTYESEPQVGRLRLTAPLKRPLGEPRSGSPRLASTAVTLRTARLPPQLFPTSVFSFGFPLHLIGIRRSRAGRIAEDATRRCYWALPEASKH